MGGRALVWTLWEWAWTSNSQKTFFVPLAFTLTKTVVLAGMAKNLGSFSVSAREVRFTQCGCGGGVGLGVVVVVEDVVVEVVDDVVVVVLVAVVVVVDVVVDVVVEVEEDVVV